MTASGAPPVTTGVAPASRPRIIAMVVAVASIVLLVDQLTKSWVVERLGDRIVPLVWTLQFDLADRLFRDNGGSVVDFIDLQWWPVFNGADIALTIGSLLLIVASFREPETKS